MKIAFIQPKMVTKEHKDFRFLNLYTLQPLAFGVLASVTPEDVDFKLYDDRLEDIPYDEQFDLVAISATTPTVKRGYKIAQEFKSRKIPVVMGGIHPTLAPEEAIEYCDSVVMGSAESIWPQVILDARNGNLKKYYYPENKSFIPGLIPERSIFKGKKYNNVYPVQFGQGCVHNCDFCVTPPFYGPYTQRAVDEVVYEISKLGRHPKVLFTDDNIVAIPDNSKELFRKLIPLGIQWVGQATIEAGQDSELLSLMRKSGCRYLLVGFESLAKDNLFQMNKGWSSCVQDYSFLIKKFRDNGIALHASFVFGYDHDDKDIFERTFKFAIASKFFRCYFHNVFPYPGTRLYKRLMHENRMICPGWWKDDAHSFGEVSFYPKGSLDPSMLYNESTRIRRKLYKFSNILKRVEFKANCRDFRSFIYFFVANLIYQYSRKRRG